MVSQPGSGARQVLINKPIQPIQQTVSFFNLFDRKLQIYFLEIGEPSSSSIVINSRQRAASSRAAGNATASATAATTTATTRQFKPKLKLPIISTQLPFVIKLFQETFSTNFQEGKRQKENA